MKLINKPAGAAGEYAKYAMSYFEGCVEVKCDYCYMCAMNKRFKKYFGEARLKESIKSNSFEVFVKEATKLMPELQKHGLFFNFSSDPFLPQALGLNLNTFLWCDLNNIPVYALTKQVEWTTNGIASLWPKNVAMGFTLTGKDELERGCNTNQQRINAMKILHSKGYKTWASIEPIIDFPSSLDMIKKTVGFCDLYKVGLRSGKKYDTEELVGFINQCLFLLEDSKIYFKNSLLEQAGISREELPDYCVTSDFNLHNP